MVDVTEGETLAAFDVVQLVAMEAVTAAQCEMKRDNDRTEDPYRRRKSSALGDVTIGIRPQPPGQRPARGRLPWLALLRRAFSLRFFVFLLIRAGILS